MNYLSPENTYAMRMLHNSMVDTNGKAQLPQGGRFSQTEVESKRYTVRNQIDFDKTLEGPCSNCHCRSGIS